MCSSISSFHEISRTSSLSWSLFSYSGKFLGAAKTNRLSNHKEISQSFKFDNWKLSMPVTCLRSLLFYMFAKQSKQCLEGLSLEDH